MLFLHSIEQFSCGFVSGFDVGLVPPATASPPCQADEFPCVDASQCISPDQVCDGTVHCDDASDELASECFGEYMMTAACLSHVIFTSVLLIFHLRYSNLINFDFFFLDLGDCVCEVQCCVKSYLSCPFKIIITYMLTAG